MVEEHPQAEVLPVDEKVFLLARSIAFQPI